MSYTKTGVHRNTNISYVAALSTPTSGTDNTAMDVKTIALPANTLARLGDRIKITTYFLATGATIKATLKLNGVELCNVSLNSAVSGRLEVYVDYIDNTHGNIIIIGSSITNVLESAGFDWSASQNIVINQDAIAASHIAVYGVITDVMPIQT